MPARREGETSVLLVGNPALPLKGFDVAIAALSAVNRVLPLRVGFRDLAAAGVPNRRHIRARTFPRESAAQRCTPHLTCWVLQSQMPAVCQQNSDSPGDAGV